MFQSDAYTFEHLSHVLNGFDSRTLMSSKNELLCNNWKESGNNHYAVKDYRNALISYNHALCHAENGSEVAGLIYANRSAVALEVKSYPECLKNIQLAREHNYPKQNLDRLIKREEKCKEMMSSNVSSENEYGKFLKLLYGSNIEGFMIDCLKIDHNKNGTRCLTTTRDLKTGDLIAVQKPFSGFLMDNSLYRYCLNCLKECVLDLIPCDGCTSVMFCSKNCKETAFEVHQYECEVIGIIMNEDKSSSGMHLNNCRALFKALSLFNGSAYKMKKYFEEKEDEASGKCTMDINDICNNEKVLFKAINGLEDTGNDHLEDFLLLYPKMKKIMAITELRNFIISFTSKIKIAVTIGEGFGNERNGGYYPLLTILNTSCAPNVYSIMVFNSKTVYIAQNPIKAGEKLTMSINSDGSYWLKNKLERQREIFHYSQMKCDCVACVENYPMLNQQKFISRSSANAVAIRLREARTICGIHALKMFKENCEYIDAHFDKSPCYEISTSLHINQVLFAKLGLSHKTQFT